MHERNSAAVESMNRPEVATEEHLRFLDELREGGSTNMFGAAPVLREVYPELSKVEARSVLGYWMRTFAERHPR